MNATFTDFSPGTMQLTHIPSDLAIDSPDAFFQVQRGSQQLLTRAGNFHRRNDGILVTPHGDPVLASDGEPIQLDPALPWRFLPGGVVEQAGDRIELAPGAAENPAALQKAGENYFAAGGTAQLAPAEDRQRPHRLSGNVEREPRRGNGRADHRLASLRSQCTNHPAARRGTTGADRPNAASLSVKNAKNTGQEALMSVQSLYTAATGMESLQSKLNVIANNLANVNTTGFKSDRANFEDLFYRHEILPGQQDARQQLHAHRHADWPGRRACKARRPTSIQGAFQETGQPARPGDRRARAFCKCPTRSPRRRSTLGPATSRSTPRAARHRLGSDGPPRRSRRLRFPQDATGISISSDGRVSCRQPGNPQLQQAGQLQLTMFQNPEGLLKLGENLYADTGASGQPQPRQSRHARALA